MGEEHSGCDRLIDRNELLEIVGLSYTTVWSLMRDGKFPRSVRIEGVNRVAWFESEVRAYLRNLPRQKLKPLVGAHPGQQDEKRK